MKRPLNKPWIVCALLGWGLFGLALMSSREAPADQPKQGGVVTGDVVNGGGAPPSSALVTCTGDVNGDMFVNIDDLLVVINNWGPCPGGCQTAAQCDDGNPCTTDTCQMGQCVHTPIAGCQTCTTNAQCATLYPNATGLCQGNLCVMGPCNMGFANCNMITADGCEVNLQTNPQNCGNCGLTCSFPNAVAVCVNGQCMIGSCNMGFQNCNGITADGCETNINNNVVNCGACGVACSFQNAQATCVNGICTMGPCSFPFANCDGLTVNGCEVNLATNASNCGSCGHPCALGQQCINGQCQ